MARKVYQLRRQFEGEKEEVVSSSTRKNEIERDFGRLVRSARKQPGCYVVEIRTGYAKVRRYLTFGELRYELWISIAPSEIES